MELRDVAGTGDKPVLPAVLLSGESTLAHAGVLLHAPRHSPRQANPRRLGVDSQPKAA